MCGTCGVEPTAWDPPLSTGEVCSDRASIRLELALRLLWSDSDSESELAARCTTKKHTSVSPVSTRLSEKTLSSHKATPPTKQPNKSFSKLSCKWSEVGLPSVFSRLEVSKSGRFFFMTRHIGIRRTKHQRTR